MTIGARTGTKWLARAAGTAVAYMAFEAQWLECREERLSVPGLPNHLEGLRILHLSDVHAGQPDLNLWTFRKAVRWAEERDLDLVFLTGDILGGKGRGTRRCLRLLSRLRPRLGMFAVTGNHEYGLSKNPFAHTPQDLEWETAGVTLLNDVCVSVRVPDSGSGRSGDLAVCGSDYLTGGRGLGGRPDMGGQEGSGREHDGKRHRERDGERGPFAILLVHRPPDPEEGVGRRFPLVFAGHTHGGQIHVPTPWGKKAIHREGIPYTEGAHALGDGLLVISRGIGTTFLPFRLLARPEAVIYTLGR